MAQGIDRKQPRDQWAVHRLRKSAIATNWSAARGRSSEQLDIWSAVFGPLGEDGYFEPLWNKKTA